MKAELPRALRIPGFPKLLRSSLVVVCAGLMVSNCATAPISAPAGSSILLEANPRVVSPNGGRSVLTAVVVDPQGTSVADGTLVTFVSDLGSVDPFARTRDGVARANFVADSRSGQASITAVAGSATSKTTITVGSGVAARVQVTANPPGISSTRRTAITATVSDADGAPVPGIKVTFSVSGSSTEETLDSGSAPVSTDSEGVAVDTLRTAAPVGNPHKTVTVNVSLASGITGSVTVPIGGNVPAFVQVAANPTHIGSSRRTAITASVYDANGNPLQGVPITLSLSGTLIQETLDSGSLPLISDANGRVVDTLRTTAPTGNPLKTVIVTARAANGVSGSVNVLVGGNVPALIQVAANPTHIGSSRRTAITASVFDASGNPLQGVPITLSLSGSLIQETLDSGSLPLISDANGRVVDTLRTTAPVGDPLKTLSVTARTTNGVSGNVTVSVGTGPPARLLVRANPQRITTPRKAAIIANVFDANGNPVPNTQVAFTLEGTLIEETLDSGGALLTSNANGQVVDTLRTTAPIGTMQKSVRVNGTTGTGVSGTVTVFIDRP